MAEDQSDSVKDAVHKLQLSLLEGIRHENQLFAAGSLMSQRDYEDVVTERSIINVCGYPLCNNPLPTERPRKGRYRISLKEHKVYDLQETYMYCSSGCVINSRAFAASLQSERCSVSNSAMINEVLRLFGGLNLGEEDDFGKKEDLGFSNLKIQEKVDTKVGEVSFEDWIGPSNAIEGYVPQKDLSVKPTHSKHREEGSKTKLAKSKKGKDKAFSDVDFTSTIIMGDEYSISKTSSAPLQNGSDTRLKMSSARLQNGSDTRLKESEVEVSSFVPKVQSGTLNELSFPNQNGSEASAEELKVVNNVGKITQSNESMLKSSLKFSCAKKLTRNVTWADEKIIDDNKNLNLSHVREMEDEPVNIDSSSSSTWERDDMSTRLSSAEACALALSKAAEAVASGESDISDAVSEAGIIILPHPNDANEGESQKDMDVCEPVSVPLKWPIKPGDVESEIFDYDDSWFDPPPEGFSLTLSSFSTMWMALFGWITSSSLAYIYGRDESCHEEFLLVTGREYPSKIVLSDGRSSEIKQTLAGCLARALPGLVMDLRLSTPISTLEQGLGRLLETMSFVDALPPFRMKQWHVIVLLFLNAVSVCRIPALTSHMTSRSLLLHKVLDGAQISGEEYEVMKDLLIPLGRLPQFSAQSGG